MNNAIAIAIYFWASLATGIMASRHADAPKNSAGNIAGSIFLGVMWPITLTYEVFSAPKDK